MGDLRRVGYIEHILQGEEKIVGRAHQGMSRGYETMIITFLLGGIYVVFLLA